MTGRIVGAQHAKAAGIAWAGGQPGLATALARYEDLAYTVEQQAQQIAAAKDLLEKLRDPDYPGSSHAPIMRKAIGDALARILEVES